MEPKGGTELQFDELKKRLPAHYWDKISITTSVPEKRPIQKGKVNILWIKNSYDQPNLKPWFEKPENHIKYDWYIFNSHWTFEKYRLYFNVPTSRCRVIKNALPTIKWRQKSKYQINKPLKLIHCSTPWRGLNILLAAMHHLQDKDISLDVYSSTQLYGDQFKEANDKHYQPLYEHARKMGNVNYIGYVPHNELIDAMQDSHIFAYPSIWEETCCISALESMAAGAVPVVTNFGALPETCGDYGIYVPYDTNPQTLAREYASYIEYVQRILPTEAMQRQVENQRQHYIHFYSWDQRIKEWMAFLNNALEAKGIANEAKDE
jgi:glycosyltransferase involved in cell wall biosynthesis